MKRMISIAIAAAVVFSVGFTAHAQSIGAGDISADSAVLIEAGTGRIVWSKNEYEKRPMASTTKIMSALITLESGDLDSEFTVDSAAVHTEGSSMGLREGDIVSKRDLCIGMLLPSGNDAANCAAVKVGGDMEGFAEMMNRRADEMGLMSTHFVTPSGLHDDEHYSTAYDMALLTSYALKNEDFAKICSEKSITLDYGDPPYTRRLFNTNKLLGMYDGCIGVKTGFTDEAGRCLVSAAQRDGVTLICVTLDASDDWNDHRKLLDHGFEAVKNVSCDIPESFEVSLAGGESDMIRVCASRKPTLVQIKGDVPDVTWKAVIPPMIYAPVQKGQILGELIICDNGREIDSIPLAAAEDAPMLIKEVPQTRMGIIDMITDKLKQLFA